MKTMEPIEETGPEQAAPPEPIGAQDKPRDRPREGEEKRGMSPPAGVAEAIEQVNEVIRTLRETLDEMEEVLETLELAERQKTGDEREIESLRRALGQLRRPRGERGN